MTVLKVKFPLTLVVSVCFGVVLLAQIALAQVGRFGLAGSVLMVAMLVLLAATVAGSLLATWVWASSATTSEMRRTGSKTGIVCAIAAILATAIYLARWVHPTENIMGGYDEGIYTITAANLARTGHYRLNAQLLPSLPAELRPWVTQQLPRMANRIEKAPPRYPCYQVCLFIEDEARGILTSQFPVGFPALLGSAHAVFGFEGQCNINPLLLFTAACLAAMLATSWLGVVAGAMTFVVWLWFPLQVWSGNARFAEVLLQLLWLLTLLGLAEKEHSHAWSGSLAGLALGVSLAVKIDALPVVAITAAVVAMVCHRSDRVFSKAFCCAFILSASVSLGALWQDNRAYVLDTLDSIVDTNRRPLLCGTILIITGSFAWALGRRVAGWEKIREAWPKFRPWATYGMIGFGLTLAAYAYFVRPQPTVPDTFYYWPQNRIISSDREETFVRLGWYWQPWGLGLAVMGMGIAIRYAREIWQRLLAGVGLLFLISFAYDIRNNPVQPYALRRFLPYAIPFMIFGAAAAGLWLPQTWLRVRKWIVTIVTVILLTGFWPINERLNRLVEYPGLIEQTTELAGKIPDNAVILVSENGPLVRLASGLEFIFNKPCLTLHRLRQLSGREQALRHAVSFWMEQGHRVFTLSPKSEETLRIPDVISRLVDHGLIQTKMKIASEKKLVTRQTELEMPYALNELIFSSSSAPTTPHRSP